MNVRQPGLKSKDEVLFVADATRNRPAALESSQSLDDEMSAQYEIL